jgi:hypothetical protein
MISPAHLLAIRNDLKGSEVYAKHLKHISFLEETRQLVELVQWMVKDDFVSTNEEVNQWVAQLKRLQTLHITKSPTQLPDPIVSPRSRPPELSIAEEYPPNSGGEGGME